MEFKSLDPDYQTKIEDAFVRQPFMAFIGARLAEVKPGYCEIHLPYQKGLSQQHGFFHAGVIGTIADNAGGCAAYSLMPAGSSILSVEYKLNLLAPGKGEMLIAQARVIKHGKTLTVCNSEVFVINNGDKKLCATSLMTTIGMKGLSDEPVKE